VNSHLKPLSRSIRWEELAIILKKKKKDQEEEKEVCWLREKVEHRKSQAVRE